jgi:hypothetical protein
MFHVQKSRLDSLLSVREVGRMSGEEDEQNAMRWIASCSFAEVRGQVVGAVVLVVRVRVARLRSTVEVKPSGCR